MLRIKNDKWKPVRGAKKKSRWSTAEERQQIASYAKENGKREAMLQFHCSYSVVRKACDEAGMPLERRGRKVVAK